MTRRATLRALALAEEGVISWQDLAEMAVRFMAEDDVAEMLDANERSERFEEDDEDEVEMINFEVTNIVWNELDGDTLPEIEFVDVAEDRDPQITIQLELEERYGEEPVSFDFEEYDPLARLGK